MVLKKQNGEYIANLRYLRYPAKNQILRWLVDIPIDTKRLVRISWYPSKIHLVAYYKTVEGLFSMAIPGSDSLEVPTIYKAYNWILEFPLIFAGDVNLDQSLSKSTCHPELGTSGIWSLENS